MLRVFFSKRKELCKPEPQNESSNDWEVRKPSPPFTRADENIRRVRSLLMDDEDDGRMSRCTTIAALYLVQFIVTGRPMPAFIERRWREVGVLTRGGVPNAAMRKWGESFITNEKTEGTLRMVLTTLGELFENLDFTDPRLYNKGEITT